LLTPEVAVHGEMATDVGVIVRASASVQAGPITLSRPRLAPPSRSRTFLKPPDLAQLVRTPQSVERIQDLAKVIRAGSGAVMGGCRACRASAS
jgi:hypothetical protein